MRLRKKPDSPSGTWVNEKGELTTKPVGILKPDKRYIDVSLPEEEECKNSAAEE